MTFEDKPDPTTDELRDLWVDSQLDESAFSSLSLAERIEMVPAEEARFNRWLASVSAPL